MRPRLVGVLILGLFVAGCASEKVETSLPKTIWQALKTMKANRADPEPARRAVEALTRKQLIGISTNPLILVDIEASRQYATLFQISSNAGYGTFLSGDRKTLTFFNGVLSATRGLGADLMSLDVAQTVKALASNIGGAVETTRTHRMLNGEDHIESTVYTCTLTNRGMETLTSIHKRFRLRRYQESCKSATAGGVTYTNDYWLDPATKIIWKSRQWVGPTVGYLGVEVLIPEK